MVRGSHVSQNSAVNCFTQLQTSMGTDMPRGPHRSTWPLNPGSGRPSQLWELACHVPGVNMTASRGGNGAGGVCAAHRPAQRQCVTGGDSPQEWGSVSHTEAHVCPQSQRWAWGTHRHMHAHTHSWQCLGGRWLRCWAGEAPARGPRLHSVRGSGE